MNGFKQILKFETIKHVKSFSIFTVTWVAIMAIFLAFFDGIKASTDGLMQLYETLPKELLQAFGKDMLTITNIYGYFGNAIILYLLLSSCIFVIILAINSLHGEISNKGLTFLHSKPLSRNSIYFGKTLAIVINSFITNILLCIASIILVQTLTKEAELDYIYFVIIFFGLFVMQLFFVGVAQIVSLKFSSRATALVSFSVILSYLLHLISGFALGADFLKYITPNYYVNFDEIAVTRSFNPSSLLVLLVGIILIWIGSIIFRNKDIEI